MTCGAALLLAALLEARTGQQLAPARHWRLEAMLQPLMKARGHASLETLVAAVTVDPLLADAVVDALLNNETSFFRDPVAFQLLQDTLVERLRALAPAQRRLKVWSAGCSTGQEVYSLAMMGSELAAALPGTRLDILGTDASGQAIERCRQGSYAQIEINRGLPIRKTLSFFTQEEGRWRIDPALARSVRFRRAALLDVATGGPFDLILCRNLLFYLPPETRRLAFDRLAAALVPGGLLMLGAGETVLGQTDRFIPDPDNRGLYCLAPPPRIRLRA